MNNGRYSLSFTTGSLFYLESVRLAALYLELGSWVSVRDKVISENLLQSRTMSTLRRVYREISSRLKTLSLGELELLVDGSRQEQTHLLWLAMCRRYRFIADFAVEVLRDRYISFKTDLSHEDFDAFLNRKSVWHSELDEIRPVTRSKMRQVLFRVLREAGLLTTSNMINSAILSRRLLDAIPRGSREDVLYFPAFESDLKRMAQ